MTSELFEEWVRTLDRMFYDKVRNIALLVDYCPNDCDNFKSDQSEALISSPRQVLCTPTDGPRSYQKSQGPIPPTSCKNVY